ncbi:hypothetical protein EMPS_10845 [Entomortierella parvispora]|uniref:Restriction of telomere capping protein 5 n=1 Tax=Entomortierella parvispora TaxID=205924 RepID=A0A9P3HKX2_9FUNG|nr:hypothetical protein EMPS_10845 [Entomortierella parvispora]
MGVAQSLLSGLDASSNQQSLEGKNPSSLQQQQQRQSADLGLSWDSGKLQRDMFARFSELELLSLRQVFQQLKDKQDKQDKIAVQSTTADGEDPVGTGDAQEASPVSTPATIPQQTQPTKKKMMESKKVTSVSQAVPGITEAVFEEYLGFPPDSTRAGKLFFRSFYNLSTYPDNPNQRPSRAGQPQSLTFRDLIKPLAMYCQKVKEDDHIGLMNDRPLKAIFESFAELAPTALSDGTNSTSVSMAHSHTAENLHLDTDGSLPLEGTLKKSKTMEDSLKDLMLHSNFEWNPEDDDFLESGPKVKALDLVEILNGLFWLIERLILDSPEYPHDEHDESTTTDSNRSHHKLRATSIVEHMIQYSRNSSHVHDPVDLTLELIDFGIFSKYVSRNMPKVFEVLSQYFYSLFLIGNVMRRPHESSTSSSDQKLVLPGLSSIPQLTSISTILTPENLALISWFLPDQKSKPPTLTNLYSGSKHGFSMNQFEVHVCKYPAPTLLLLSVVRQKTPATPTMSGGVNRRQSISFGTTSNRHRHSISSNSPPYSIPWGIDTRRTSFEKLTGRSPTTPVSTGTVLNTILDDVATTDSLDSKGERKVDNDPLASSPKVSAPRISSDSNNGHTPTTPTKRVSRERMILGAYVTETWKVSKAGWGNESFSLFELSPCFELFPARKQGATSTTLGGGRTGFPPSSARSLPGSSAQKTNHARSSTTGASRDYPFASPAVARSSSPVTVAAPDRHYIHFLKNAGVGFGGQESDSCMLYLDDNLQFGNYRQDFAGGNVYQPAGGVRQQGFQVEFEIVECEVWGLGGAEAKARQQKEWDFEQREANRRASVHLGGRDGEQDIDRDLLEMAGVIDPDRGHRHARRQSVL